MGENINNAMFAVLGKGVANDDVQVESVFCQLNGGDWLMPATTNNWTNWSVTVTPAVGTNELRVYSMDALGKRSQTKSASFTFSLIPTLSTMSQGGGIVLMWQTNAVGFSLESTPNFAPLAVWNSVLPPATISGSNYVITNPISGGAKFFRLKK